MSEPFDADPEDIAEFLNDATRAPVALGQRPNFHQCYEDSTECLWCGTHHAAWGPMERCHPGIVDDPLAPFGEVPS